MPPVEVIECPILGEHIGRRTDEKPNNERDDTMATQQTTSKKVTPEKAAAPRPSVINAAAKVLSGSKEPLTAKQMIEQMAAEKLWNSLSGKTPDATLYAEILQEIQSKGNDSRFVKVDRDHFGTNQSH